jgi:hypothetical protein
MNTPCCEWTGKKNAKGYGIVFLDGKQMFVHRLAVVLSGRDIPKGKVCDHLCRNHSCYNPEHIEIVSIAENVMRGEGPAAIAARRTHCAKGHEYTEENTRLQVDKKGRTARHCRRCYSVRARKPGMRSVPNARKYE